MTQSAILHRLREAAEQEGFVLCGVAPAVASPGFDQLTQWVESGYAAGMDFFAGRLEAYRHPDHVLAGAKSIAALAIPYAAAESSEIVLGQGRLARYAWDGDDYHDVIHGKLKRICAAVQNLPPVRARGVVDTAPLMEREIAQLAGLGWRGKNTLLLHPALGSYFFLACVLVDVELETDMPFESFHCGSCTACLNACPTDAFPQPGVLDASRCISYLTIEHRGPIPSELRSGIGDWVFGCDVCQEVCPWNRKRSRGDVGEQNAAQQAKSLETLDLASLFFLKEETFRQRFRKTPLWRARRRGILRNAAIVLGNQRDTAAEAALVFALRDEEPVIRGAAAWALGRLNTPSARESLRSRAAEEADETVQREIESALVNDPAAAE